MVSYRALLAAAPLLAVALAQNARIAFTSVPAEAVAGEDYNITWGGGDGSPATLTLRKGDPNNLDTVGIIASDVEESYYVWTVPDNLESSDDYALQITQGLDDINYSGIFAVTGGDGSSNTTVATTTAASNSSMSITSMASASGTGTAIPRNTTFSSASLTSSEASETGSSSSRTSLASRTSAAQTSAETTVAPSNDAALRTGSSAALILGIVAAILLH